MISNYFLRVKSTLGEYAHIISSYSTSEKTYSDKKGFIAAEIIFYDESKLDFAEVKNTNELGKKKYRYHYRNENDQLIFRYDNAKHYPTLSTFPHHKHTPENVEESEEPEIEGVLSEIERIVVKKKK